MEPLRSSPVGFPSFASGPGWVSQSGLGLPVRPLSSMLSPVAQFSLDLAYMTAHAFQSLRQGSSSQIPETQLSTEQIMHELFSGDSEVQFPKRSGC